MPDNDDATGPWALRAACIIAACIIATVLGILPFATTSLPVVPPFLPICATTVCIVEGLTAYFLAIKFRASGEVFLGALAGAYGFVVVTAFLQLLIFPGVFTAAGLLGAGPQSAVWMWVIWHTGYPLLALLALLTRQLPASPRGRRVGIALMLGGPAAAAFFTCLAIAGGGVLPQLLQNISYHGVGQRSAGVLVLVTNITALAACIRLTRLRELVSLWLAVALLASLGDSVLGIAADSRYSAGWYVGRYMAVVSSSVVLCAIIFEFSRLYGKLVDANRNLASRALHDGLTGAFNRGYLIEQFPREVGRAVRSKSPLCLMMIDVDHFKSYNDIHGHQAGDDCLIGVVGAITSSLRRPTDFVARYGGEEFAVVLPGTGREGAMQVIAAMRGAVQGLTLPATARGGPVTVSVGLACFDPAEDLFAPEELIRRADLALYQAKQNGRDAVFEFAAAPVAL